MLRTVALLAALLCLAVSLLPGSPGAAAPAERAAGKTSFATGLTGCGKTVGGKRQVGVVRKIKGGLALRRAGKWRKAKVGLPLYQKDRVRTKTKQRALLQSCDKSRLFLNHATDASFPGTALTEVKDGEVRQVVPAGKQHELRTAQADAFGRDLDVRVSGSTSTFVAVHGTAQVENGEGSRVLQQDQGTVVAAGHAPGPAKRVDAAKLTAWTGPLSSPASPTATPTPTSTPTTIPQVSPVSSLTSTPTQVVSPPSPTATPTQTQASGTGPLSISSSDVLFLAVGDAVTQPLMATGGTPPYTWFAGPGGLPGWLTLSPAGVLSGTPPVAGTFSVVVAVQDSTGATASQTLSLRVGLAPPTAPPSPTVVVTPGPLRITTTSLPDAAADPNKCDTYLPYSASLGATGGVPPYSWSLLGGSLPPGLGLSPDGTISGMPQKPGTYEFRLGVIDSQGTRALTSLSIFVPNPTPCIIPVRASVYGYAVPTIG